VGNETIKASDLILRYRALPPAMQRNITSETRYQLVDSAARGKIVEIMAKKAGLDTKTYLQRLMATDLAVSDSEIAGFIKHHPKDIPNSPQRNQIARARVMSSKFNTWLEKAKLIVPVKIDEAAVTSLDLSKY
jgi:hypothetical protein